MVEAIAAFFLEKYVGKYVDNIDSKNLSLSILNQQLELENLDVKPDALADLNLPIEVKAGHIGFLSVRIPIFDLSNSPTVLTLKNVYLLAGPTADRDYDEELDERLQTAAKNRMVENYESIAGQNQEKDDSEGDPSSASWFDTMLVKVMNKIQVTIENVHIRYEDRVTSPKKPFAFGIVLQELSLRSEEDTVQDGFMQKLLKLIGLSVYWTCNISRDHLLCDRQAVPVPDWKEHMLSGILKGSVKGHTFSYLMEPVSGKADVLVNQTGKATAPLFQCTAVLDDINMWFSREMYLLSLTLKKSFALMDVNTRYRKYRPSREVFGNAPLWWQYALNAYIGEKKRPYQWGSIKKHRQRYRAYKDLYLRYLTEKDPALQKSLEEAARDLDAQNIVTARTKAKVEYVKESPERKARKKPQKKGGGGILNWLWGGGSASSSGSGSSDVSVIKDDSSSGFRWNSLSEEEKRALYKSVGMGTRDTDAADWQVKYQVTATFKKSQFCLTAAGGLVLAAVTSSQKITVQLRPEISAFKFGMEVGAFVIQSNEDDLKTGRLTSYVVAPLFEDGCSTKKLLSLTLEQNPTDSDADYELNMDVSPVEVVYDKIVLEKVMDFFTLPESAYGDSQFQYVSKIGSAGVQYALYNHQRVAVAVKIRSPYVVIPELPNYKEGIGRVMVLDLGLLSITSVLQPKDTGRSKKSKDEPEMPMDENRIYDQFLIDISEVTALFGDSVKDWKLAEMVDDSSVVILPPMEMELKLFGSVAPDYQALPRYKLEGRLKAISLTLSERLLKKLASFSQNVAKPLTTKDAATEGQEGLELEGFEKITLYDTNIVVDAQKLLEIAQLVLDTCEYSNDPARESPKMVMNSPEEYFYSASDYSDEDIEEWKLATELPGFDNKDTVRSNYEIGRFHLEMDSVRIEVTVSADTDSMGFSDAEEEVGQSEKSSDQQKQQLYLRLGVNKLCTRFSTTVFGMEAEATLDAFYLKDSLHPDAKGQPSLIASSDGKTFQMTYRQVSPDCPDFHGAYNSVSEGTTVRMSKLRLCLEKEAMVYLVSFTQRLSACLFDPAKPAPSAYSTTGEGKSQQATPSVSAFGSRTSLTQYPSKAGRFLANGYMEDLSVKLLLKHTAVASMSVRGLNVNMTQGRSRTIYKAQLKYLRLTDPVGGLYPTILSVEDDETRLFELQLIQFNHSTPTRNTEDHPASSRSLRVRGNSLDDFKLNPASRILPGSNTRKLLLSAARYSSSSFGGKRLPVSRSTKGVDLSSPNQPHYFTPESSMTRMPPGGEKDSLSLYSSPVSTQRPATRSEDAVGPSKKKATFTESALDSAALAGSSVRVGEASRAKRPGSLSQRGRAGLISQRSMSMYESVGGVKTRLDYKVNVTVSRVTGYLVWRFASSSMDVLSAFFTAGVQAQAGAAASAAKMNVNIKMNTIQQQALHVRLDVCIKAPRLIIPENSTSSHALLVLLGDLKLTNRFINESVATAAPGKGSGGVGEDVGPTNNAHAGSTANSGGFHDTKPGSSTPVTKEDRGVDQKNWVEDPAESHDHVPLRAANVPKITERTDAADSIVVLQQLDEISVNIENVTVSRCIVTMNTGLNSRASSTTVSSGVSDPHLRDIKTILSPIRLSASVRRALEPIHDTVPHWEVSAEMKTIQITVSQADIQMLGTIMKENLDDSATEKIAAAADSTDARFSLTPGITRQGATDTVSGYPAPEVKPTRYAVSFTMLGLELSLHFEKERRESAATSYRDSRSSSVAYSEIASAVDSHISDTMREVPQPFLVISIGVLSTRLRGDSTGRTAGSASLERIGMVDVEKMGSAKRLVISVDEECKSLIEVTFDMGPSHNNVVMRMRETRVNVTIPLLVTLQKFSTAAFSSWGESNPAAKTSLVAKASEVNSRRSALVRRASTLRSRWRSSVSSAVGSNRETPNQEPYRTVIKCSMERQRIALYPRDGSGEVLLVEADMGLDYTQIGTSSTKVSLTLGDVQMRFVDEEEHSESQTTTHSHEKRVLDKCTVYLTYLSETITHHTLSTRPQQSEQHVTVTLTPVKLNVCTLLLTHMWQSMDAFKETTQELERGSEVEPTFDLDSENLWDVADVSKEDWLAHYDSEKPRALVSLESTRPPRQYLEFELPDVCLQLEVMVMDEPLPILKAWTSLSGNITDWSSQTRMLCEVSLDMSYYNEKQAKWEFLLEPTMEGLDKHCWQSVVRAVASQGHPITTTNPEEIFDDPDELDANIHHLLCNARKRREREAQRKERAAREQMEIRVDEASPSPAPSPRLLSATGSGGLDEVDVSINMFPIDTTDLKKPYIPEYSGEDSLADGWYKDLPKAPAQLGRSRLTLDNSKDGLDEAPATAPSTPRRRSFWSASSDADGNSVGVSVGPVYSEMEREEDDDEDDDSSSKNSCLLVSVVSKDALLLNVTPAGSSVINRVIEIFTATTSPLVPTSPPPLSTQGSVAESPLSATKVMLQAGTKSGNKPPLVVTSDLGIPGCEVAFHPDVIVRPGTVTGAGLECCLINQFRMKHPGEQEALHQQQSYRKRLNKDNEYLALNQLAGFTHTLANVHNTMGAETDCKDDSPAAESPVDMLPIPTAFSYDGKSDNLDKDAAKSAKRSTPSKSDHSRTQKQSASKESGRQLTFSFDPSANGHAALKGKKSSSLIRPTQLGRDQFHLFVPGFHPLFFIPFEKAGVKDWTLAGMSGQDGAGADQRWCVRVRTEVCRGRRTVHISSNFSVVNSLTTRMGIFDRNSNKSSGAGSGKHRLVRRLEPGGVFSVPLFSSNMGRLFVRPMGDSQESDDYQLCSKAIRWQDHRKSKGKRSVNIDHFTCTSKSQTYGDFHFKVIWTRESCKSRSCTSDCGHFTATISPCLFVKNVLHKSITVTIRGMDNSRVFVKDREIKEGKGAHMNLDLQTPVIMNIKMDGYHEKDWHGSVRLVESKSDPVASDPSVNMETSTVRTNEAMAAEEEGQGEREVGLIVKVRQEDHCVRATVYASYWIVNKTTESLEIVEHSTSDVHLVRGGEPFLFQPKKKRSKKVRLRTTESGWSSVFRLDTIGSPISLTCSSHTSSRQYHLLAMAHTSSNRLTTIISVHSQFVLANHLPVPIQYSEYTPLAARATPTKTTSTTNTVSGSHKAGKPAARSNQSDASLLTAVSTNELSQANITASNENGSGESSTLLGHVESNDEFLDAQGTLLNDGWTMLSVGDIRPFFPLASTSAILIRLGDGQPSSMPFDYRKAKKTALRVGNQAVTVDITGGVVSEVIISFNKYEPGDAPLRIVNVCDNVKIQLHQKNESGMFLVNPKTSFLYTWANPVGNRQLLWRVFGSKKKGTLLNVYENSKINKKRVKVHEGDESTSADDQWTEAGDLDDSYYDNNNSDELSDIREDEEDTDDAGDFYDVNNDTGEDCVDGMFEDGIGKAIKRRMARSKKPYVTVYWASYMENMERFITFTDDKRVRDVIGKKDEAEMSTFALFVALQSVGISLMNQIPLEVAYMSMSHSPPVWHLKRDPPLPLSSQSKEEERGVTLRSKKKESKSQNVRFGRKRSSGVKNRPQRDKELHAEGPGDDNATGCFSSCKSTGHNHESGHSQRESDIGEVNTASKPKEIWDPAGSELSVVLEDSFQKDKPFLKIPAPSGKLQDSLEVDFSRMMMLRPFVAPLRRESFPALRLQYQQSDHYISVHARFHRLQVDNQLPNAYFPIVFHPTPLPKLMAKRLGQKPVMELAVLRFTKPESKTDTFRYVKALVQEVSVNVDMGFGWTVSQLLTDLMIPDDISPTGSFITDEQVIDGLSDINAESEAKEWETDLCVASQSFYDDACIKAQQSSDKVYIEYLHLSPLKMRVSFSMGGDKFLPEDNNAHGAVASIRNSQEFINRIGNSVGVAFAQTQNTELRMSCFEMRGHRVNATQLFTDIKAHYWSQFMWQIYAVLFGLDILGNPYGLIRDVGRGFDDLFYEPFMGSNQTPGDFGGSVVLGVQSFFSSLAGGTAGSAALFTKSLGRIAVALTFDEQYKAKRLQRLSRQPNNFFGAVVLAGKNFVLSTAKGVTGVVRLPYRGCRSGGAAGLAKGVGQGAIGLFVKPLGGALDSISVVFEGLRQVAELGVDGPRRMRLPRFTMPNEGIMPYSEYQARGCAFLNDLKEGSGDLSDAYWAHLVIPKSRRRKKSVLLISTQWVRLLHKPLLSSFWKSKWQCKVGLLLDTLSVDEERKCLHLEYKTENSTRTECRDIFYPDQTDPFLLERAKQMIETAFQYSLG